MGQQSPFVNFPDVFSDAFFCRDVNVFHEGIGDKIAQFFQWTATFVAGLIVGFTTGWKIAVVVLSTLPLLALAGFVMNKVDLDSFTQGRGGSCMEKSVLSGGGGVLYRGPLPHCGQTIRRENITGCGKLQKRNVCTNSFI